MDYIRLIVLRKPSPSHLQSYEIFYSLKNTKPNQTTKEATGLYVTAFFPKPSILFYKDFKVKHCTNLCKHGVKQSS